MKRDRRFNVLVGIIMASHLEYEEKRELIEFVREI